MKRTQNIHEMSNAMSVSLRAVALRQRAASQLRRG
jgi:hypothetical protein